MIGSLKYWNNGEPTLPDTGLGSLKYWINGEAYVVLTEETVGTNINSDRSAKTHGKLTTTNERGAKIHGKSTISDTRASKIKGGTLTNSERSSHIKGGRHYSRESSSTLKTTDDTLSTNFNEQDYTNVGTDNDVYVDLTGSNKYFQFLFKEPNKNNTDGFKVTWKGKSTVAPSSHTVYLQIYNRTTASWTTLTSNNTASANTEFTLESTVNTNISDYYDANYVVSCRLYQEAI